MTIYQLKKLNQANGGTFFERRTMKSAGDTLKNLGVLRHNKTTWRVYRKKPKVGQTLGWYFRMDTGRVTFS